MTTRRRTLTAYLTEREYAEAQRLAERYGTTISKLVIRLVKDESQRVGPASAAD